MALMKEGEELMSNLFSALSPLSPSMQACVREAFEMKYKTAPESNPLSFRHYIYEQAKKDECLQAALDQLKSSELAHRSVPLVKEAMTEQPTDENEPINVVFSKSSPETPQKAMRKKITFSSEKTSGSENINPLAGCLCDNREAVVVTIDRKDALEICNYQYLDSTPEDLRDALEWRARHVGQRLLSTAEALGAPLWSKTSMSRERSVFIGRIIGDSDKALTEHSAVLELLSFDEDEPPQWPLQFLLPHLASYEVFPGQTCLAVGFYKESLTGGQICPEQFVPGLPVPPATLPRTKVETLQKRLQGFPIHVVVAAGPYCASTNFDTDLWAAMVQTWEFDRPHIIILLGPFVDIHNNIVEKGDPVLRLTGEPSATFLSYEDLYVLVLGRVLKSQALRSSTIILVPSVNDVCHPYPVPQPPLDLARIFGEAIPANVIVAPNPCDFTLCDALRFSVFSGDAVGPVATSLITKGIPSEQRAALNHAMLLKQRTLFPLHPAHFPVEPKRFRDCLWDDDSLPHIVVHSSARLRPDLRIVEGRAFINPGAVVGRSASRFAQFWISFDSQRADTSTEDQIPLDLSRLIHCEIFKDQ